MTQKKKRGESVHRPSPYRRVLGFGIGFAWGFWGVVFIVLGIRTIVEQSIFGLIGFIIGIAVLSGCVLILRAVFCMRLVLTPYGITYYDLYATYSTTWENIEAIYHPGVHQMPSWSLPSTDFYKNISFPSWSLPSTDFYKNISLIFHKDIEPIWSFPLKPVRSKKGINVAPFALGKKLWGDFIDTPLAHELKYYLPEQFAVYEDKLQRRGVLL